MIHKNYKGVLGVVCALVLGMITPFSSVGALNLNAADSNYITNGSFEESIWNLCIKRENNGRSKGADELLYTGCQR